MLRQCWQSRQLGLGLDTHENDLDAPVVASVGAAARGCTAEHSVARVNGSSWQCHRSGGVASRSCVQEGRRPAVRLEQSCWYVTFVQAAGIRGYTPKCLPPGVPSAVHRSRPDASTRALREAAALLRSAAGVYVATSIAPADQAAGKVQQSAARVIEYGDPAASHPAALWELAKAYDKGQQP